MACRAHLVAFGLVALVGCGGSQTNVAGTQHSSIDAAQLARQANDPRANDPTGGPVSTGPATSTSTRVETSAPSIPVVPMGSAAPASAPPAKAAAATVGTGEVEPPRKVSARHVLVQWMGSERAGKSVLRTREQAQLVADEVLKRAQAGDDVGRLAVEYSDEPNAATRGGSLGRFGRGQMVPAFEQVVFKLRVGEISGIVETPFGFHVIQRTE